MPEETSKKQFEPKGLAKFVGATLVAVSLVAFIVQNTDSTPFQWFFIDRRAPLWLIIVISALAGAVVSEVVGWLIRRRR